MYHFSLRLLQVATNSYITKKVPVLDEQTLKVTRYKYKLTKMKIPEATVQSLQVTSTSSVRKR